jgi:ribosomal protein S1
MSQRIIAILAALIAAVGAFRANMVPKRAVGWSRASEVVSSAKPVIRTRAWMAMAEEKTKVDFSTYAVGQEYTGTLVGAKQFGVFVDIKTGTNVLLPRSLLSRGNYEKLKQLSDSKSKETVKIEIVGVSAENQTLSGKYIPAGYKVRPDLSTLSDKDVQSRFFNATVVSAHDFGVFAELDEFGVEGLIPVSKLPGNGGSVQKSFKYVS